MELLTITLITVLIVLALVAGNRIRKLERLLAESQQLLADHIGPDKRSPSGQLREARRAARRRAEV